MHEDGGDHTCSVLAPPLSDVGLASRKLQLASLPLLQDRPCIVSADTASPSFGRNFLSV